MPPKKLPGKKPAGVLDSYRNKRNFGETPEPSPERAPKSGHSFVVQEHHARSHHFDLRLEIDGVLASWAVPKGIPMDSVAKRLAIHVEDHPLKYGKFEGEIPKGNYGAGTVTIWDSGTWEPLSKEWRKEFMKGKLKFILKGKKLQGTYVLMRMQEEPNWLIRKLADASTSNTNSKPIREKAEFVPPQLARVVGTPPIDDDWWHEIKLDGYRLIAVKRDGKVRLFTRNALDWTKRFQNISEELADLTPKDFVLDGEAVVFDKKGRSHFGHLQAAIKGKNEKRIAYVAFDLINLNGYSLRNLPLSSRLEELKELIGTETETLRLSHVWTSGARDLLQQACANGLEGIISKKAQGIYASGSRRDWVKSKCRARQEFVICGYTPPKGSLRGFGALLLASFENGKIIPRGKVGTGFTVAGRHKLLKIFKPLITKTASFTSDEPGLTWLKPSLVAEVEFAEITREGSIRQGSFIALRGDKDALDVHLDSVQTSSPDGKNPTIAGISISHPERLVYPSDGISKLQIARYYDRVGDYMLPHVQNRPLALLRSPSGITGDTFFQKSFSSHLPDHVRQKKLDDGATVFFIKDTSGLVSLAQYGGIEFHPWGSSLPKSDRPDTLIWDLDPDVSVPWPEVQGAALLLRDSLLDWGLNSVIKTSGGKGLHIIIHIKRTHDWDAMRTFTKAVAARIAKHNPSRFVITSTKAKRKGKIFIDWMRNGQGSTCVAPWSLRARPGAPVSMPINWADLQDATAAGYTIHEPLTPPSEWENITPQLVSKALLKSLA